METEKLSSGYLNPIMEHYECDGQISIFEFIEEEEEKEENDIFNR